MNINFIASWIVGTLCALFWFAVLLWLIWMEPNEKKSSLRPGEYINSEIKEDEDK